MNPETELMHYGVPGMKWGVRKRPASSGGTRKKKKTGIAKLVAKGKAAAAKKAKEKAAKAEEEAKRKASNSRNIDKGSFGKKAKKESYKNLSDDELRKVVQRISLEQQYAKLTATKTGKEKVQDFMKSGGKVMVKAIAIVGVYGGVQALAKKYGLTDKQAENLERTMQVLKILGS